MRYDLSRVMNINFCISCFAEDAIGHEMARGMIEDVKCFINILGISTYKVFHAPLRNGSLHLQWSCSHLLQWSSWFSTGWDTLEAAGWDVGQALSVWVEAQQDVGCGDRWVYIFSKKIKCQNFSHSAAFRFLRRQNSPLKLQGNSYHEISSTMHIKKNR